MEQTASLCSLCGHAAAMIDTDRGNRSYVACSSAECGDYEISKRAAREVANNSGRKRALIERIVQANVTGQVLEITVDANGQIQAASVTPT